MDPKIFIHVYVSSAVVPFSKEELQKLLTKSRENNTALGITGLLLAQDGNFMQMLEGPEQPVRDLAAKIHKDPRHKGLITLLEERTDKCQFPDWKMGFRDLQSPRSEHPLGFSEFLNTSLGSDEFVKDPTKCYRFMMTFKKSLR
jgi:hypothetical protein